MSQSNPYLYQSQPILDLDDEGITGLNDVVRDSTGSVDTTLASVLARNLGAGSTAVGDNIGSIRSPGEREIH